MSDLDSLINTVTCCDALALMEQLPPASMDAIITDLPYGTTQSAWDEIIPFEPMWAGVRRVLKPRGVFVTTASQPFTSKLVMSNLAWFRCEWIWEKNRGSNFLNAQREPLKEHENLLIFSERAGKYYPQLIDRKDKARAKYPYKADSRKQKGYGAIDFPTRYSSNINLRMPGTVLRYGTERGLHFNQKPVALYEYLIRTYTQPGEIVLDFCCGSGTTGVAARNLNRRYILGDNSPVYCDVARKRLAQDYTLPMFETLPADS